MITRVVTALALLALTGSPAAADPQQNLTITLEDKGTEVTADQPLDYRITLRNTGTDATTADVELTLPVGARALDIRDGGTAPEPWFASWSLSVPAGGTTTVSATFRPGPARPEAKGHTATACLVRDYARLLCATDVDQLPGAPDIHALAGPAQPDQGSPWLVPALAGTLTALAAATALHLRNRRRAAAGGEAEPA